MVSLPTLLLFTQMLLELFSLRKTPVRSALAAAHIRLPDDRVANLGPAKPEHLLLQGKSGEGAL